MLHSVVGHRVTLRVALLGGFLLTGSAALADAPAFSQIPPYLLERMTHSGTFDDFYKQLRQEAQRIDYDRNGLDAQDLAIAEQVANAQRRAMMLSQVMMLDLDGDGAVTAEEATRATTYQYSRQGNDNQEAIKTEIARSVERAMANDTNHDGTLTMAEIIEVPLDEQRNRDTTRSASLLALDPNKDGRLTVEELEQLARQAFEGADYDHDGELSNNEIKLLASARAFQQQIEQAMPCDLHPGTNDIISVLGTYAGAWQPTVTLEGQDAVTHLAIIKIEPGDRPIYLVLNSFYPMIWKFTGATERLSHVVAIRHQRGDKISEAAGAGVIGVAAEKVAFLPPKSCGQVSYKPDSKQAMVMAGVIARVTGREPDAMLASYAPNTIAVPSGTETKIAQEKDLVIVPGAGNDVVILGENSNVKVVQGNGSGASQEDWLADPATLIKVDPAEVVAPGKVEPYIVLPRQYGLRQLVEEGKLERTEDGYRIVKPIPRFPTGLAGAHAVTFYLPEGMPLPEGDLGHSEIILEKKVP
jgi:Ca2+-binding EF-hand superfamily protein